jgi:hypothetical protein
LSGLVSTQPRMPYGLASLSDQFKHTAFGESILLAHFGSGRSAPRASC